MTQLQASVAVAPPPALPGGAGARWRALTLAMLATLAVLAVALFADAPPPQTASSATGDYGKLPLAFVPNAGQTADQVRYTAQGGGFSFYFTNDKAVLSLQKGERGHALEMRFVGASANAKLVATDRGEGRVNYLTGYEHHTDLPTYHQLIYRDLWPGIDMAFRGAGGQLKYEFRLAPDANPDQIRLAYAGADGLALGAGGALLVDTPLGTLRDSRPTTYQRIDGKRTPVDSRYSVAGSSYGFALGAHDTSRALVIDPGLDYSTFLGGSDGEVGVDVAVDSQGSAYVTGVTQSGDFPTTAGAHDAALDGCCDAFVTKLNPAGSGLVYSTYLGGTELDLAGDITLDGAGNAYVIGNTQSEDFPTTPGAYDTTFNGGVNGDAFVAKLNAAGSGLVYSTYVGGSGHDDGQAIVVDGTGNASVTGATSSTDFPTTAGAHDTTMAGGDAYVTRLNAAGSGLLYSTYLGGADGENGLGIATDSAGNAYVAGNTRSTDFPTTPGAYDETFNGNSDMFVTKLNPTGTGLLHSTYLGGTSNDMPGVGGNGIAVDVLGNSYVGGRTESADFPTTAGAHDETFNGGGVDASVTKLDSTGSGLVYSTYLGGSGGDEALSIALDDSASAYVGGQTGSTDYPTTADAHDSTLSPGFSDALVTKLNATGSSLAYSTYLGGELTDFAIGIAVDASGSPYVTGQTSSADFPTTSGAFDTTRDGSQDAFVTKLETVAAPAGPATITLAPPDAVNNVGTTHTVTATVKDAFGNPTPNITVRFTVAGSTTTSGSCTTNTSGQCSFSYQGPDLPGADMIDAYADTDADNTRDVGEPEAVPATKAWVLPTSTTGHVTGGGLIPNAAANDKIAFGFNAKSDANGVKGECTLVDPSTDTKVKCLDATTVVKTATHATIFGNAEVNGTATSYRIDVDDLAEPGKNADTFRIQTASGYSAGGTLKSGNVQVH